MIRCIGPSLGWSLLLLAGVVGTPVFSDPVEVEPAIADLQNAAPATQSLQVALDVTLNGDVALVEVAQAYPEGALYIDFRTADEDGVALSRDDAMRLGMRYESIPVDGPKLTDAAVQRLEELLGDRSHYQQTVLRCGSGNRAAMMWGATRLDAGESLDQVLKQVQPIVTNEQVAQSLRDYAASRDL